MLICGESTTDVDLNFDLIDSLQIRSFINIQPVIFEIMDFILKYHFLL